jgi:hypothetical protein
MIGESDLEYFARQNSRTEPSRTVALSSLSSLTSGHNVSIASIFWRNRSATNHSGLSTLISLFPSLGPPPAG